MKYILTNKRWKYTAGGSIVYRFPVYEIGDTIPDVGVVTAITKPETTSAEQASTIYLDNSDLVDINYKTTVNTETDLHFGGVAKGEVTFTTFIYQQTQGSYTVNILDKRLALLVKSDGSDTWDLVGIFNITTCSKVDDMYQFTGYDDVQDLDANCADFMGRTDESGSEYKWYKFTIDKSYYPDPGIVTIATRYAEDTSMVYLDSDIAYNLSGNGTMVSPALGQGQEQYSVPLWFLYDREYHSYTLGKYIYFSEEAASKLSMSDDETVLSTSTPFDGPWGASAIYRIMGHDSGSSTVPAYMKLQYISISARETLTSSDPDAYPEGVSGDYYYHKFYSPNQSGLIQPGYLTYESNEYSPSSVLYQLLDYFDFTYTLNYSTNAKFQVTDTMLRGVDMSGAEVLSNILQLTGCYARLDYDGWNSSGSSYAFTTEFRHLLLDWYKNRYTSNSLLISDEQVALYQSETDTIWIQDETNSGVMVGLGTNEMDIADNIFAAKTSGVMLIGNLYSRIASQLYTPKKLKLLTPFITSTESEDEFMIKIGDQIVINNQSFYVMHLELNQNGCTIECTGNIERES